MLVSCWLSKLIPLLSAPSGRREQRQSSTNFATNRLQDSAWLERRSAVAARDAPIAIYEVHLGSWRRRLAEGGRYLTYRELAEELIPYVRDLGFTHIELMPVSEYPFDGSWGYQPIGCSRRPAVSARPTSSATSLSAAMARASRHHRLGRRPFPRRSCGLANFDGTALYEHADPRQGATEIGIRWFSTTAGAKWRLSSVQRTVLARSVPCRWAAG